MSPIGIFDSGYGGLTVFRDIVTRLPQYDYIYLGDNARVPYGPRSFETVYRYTKECVEHLFDLGCRLVVLACNTASAKALRSFQQQDLAHYTPDRKVLGVIRPTTELVGQLTHTGHIGILATAGTVLSESYRIEINKFSPEVRVWQQPCPMWVPLIENNEHLNPGADYFVQKYLDALLTQSPDIDTIVLACTHYPLLISKIKLYLPEGVQVLSQGPIVADSLADYLIRHPEVDAWCSRQGQQTFYTTDSTTDFDVKAEIFLGRKVTSRHLEL